MRSIRNPKTDARDCVATKRLGMDGPTLLRVKRKRSACHVESIVLEREAHRISDEQHVGGRKTTLSEDIERALQLVGVDAKSKDEGRKRVRSMYRKLETYEEVELDRSDVVLSLRDVLERRKRGREADVGPGIRDDASNAEKTSEQDSQHFFHPCDRKKKKGKESQDLMMESFRMYDLVRLEDAGTASRMDAEADEWSASSDRAHVSNRPPDESGARGGEGEYVYDVYVATDEDADAHPKAPVVYFDDDLDGFYFETSERQVENSDSEDSNDENYVGNEYPDESESYSSTILSEGENQELCNTDWSRSSEEYEDYL